MMIHKVSKMRTLEEKEFPLVEQVRLEAYMSTYLVGGHCLLGVNLFIRTSVDSLTEKKHFLFR